MQAWTTCLQTLVTIATVVMEMMSPSNNSSPNNNNDTQCIGHENSQTDNNTHNLKEKPKVGKHYVTVIL